MDVGAEDQSSPQALEGTAAHGFASTCLITDLDAWQCIGHKDKETDIECTAEMAGHIQTYIDYVRSIAGKVEVEVMFESDIHTDLGGTADALVTRGGIVDSLHVVDFKYGQGIYVDEEDNEQLMLYGLMACMKKKHHGAIRLTIVQPRAGGEPIRHADYTAADLYKWRDEVLKPAIAATPAFSAGSWCKFCIRGAALRCPLTLAIFETYAKTNMGPVSDEALDTLYELKPVVQEVQRWIDASMLKRLNEGYQSAAAKLVQGKADRQWKDGAEEAANEVLGEPYKKVFRSPADIEKDGAVAKKFVQEWAYKPDGKTSVAPLTDKRARISIQPPQDAFKGLKGQ